MYDVFWSPVLIKNLLSIKEIGSYIILENYSLGRIRRFNVNIGVIKGFQGTGKNSRLKETKELYDESTKLANYLWNSMTALFLIVISGIVFAYPDYSGCKSCHDGFEEDNYVSKSDGANWNESLMDGHETFVGGECDACRRKLPF
jgi:hypothetical protein